MTNQIHVKKDGYFEINEKIAGLVPMALEAEQVALNQDIKENGQREPVVLWKGKIIDGRCRQHALKLYNMQIEYKELDNELTEEEVAIFVKSVNTRRNLTLTQKIITATKASLEPNSESIPKTATSWGISKASLDNGRFIAKLRPDLLEPLFNGKSVKIINADGEEVDSNKVTAVYAYVKRESEKITVTETKEYAFKATTYINTQVGKEWFFAQQKELKFTDVKIQILIADLANLKFKLDIEELSESTQVLLDDTLHAEDR